MELVILIALIWLITWLQAHIYEKYAFRALEYKCRFSKKEAMEDSEIQLIETVANKKFLPLPWFKAELTTSKWLELPQSTVTDQSRFLSSFFMVKSYQRVTRSWQVKCNRRGVFTIEKAALVSSDLLQGTMLSQPAKTAAEVTVLPQALDLTDAFVSATSTLGDVVVRRYILPDPFSIAGVREYTDRDPVNHIHWAATAHEGRIMVYHNDYTASQRQSVILNIQSRPYGDLEAVDSERMELAIKACAGIFESTIQMGMPVSFRANAKAQVVVGEASGPEQLHELLLALAQLDLKIGAPFAAYLTEIDPLIDTSDLAIVTCYLDERIMDFARKKSNEGMKVKIFVMAAVDTVLAPDEVEVYQIREGMVSEK